MFDSAKCALPLSSRVLPVAASGYVGKVCTLGNLSTASFRTAELCTNVFRAITEVTACRGYGRVCFVWSSHNVVLFSAALSCKLLGVTRRLCHQCAWHQWNGLCFSCTLLFGLSEIINNLGNETFSERIHTSSEPCRSQPGWLVSIVLAMLHLHGCLSTVGLLLACVCLLLIAACSRDDCRHLLLCLPVWTISIYTHVRPQPECVTHARTPLTHTLILSLTHTCVCKDLQWRLQAADFCLCGFKSLQWRLEAADFYLCGFKSYIRHKIQRVWPSKNICIRKRFALSWRYRREITVPVGWALNTNN